MDTLTFESHPLVRHLRLARLVGTHEVPPLPDVNVDLPELLVSQGITPHDDVLRALETFYGVPALPLLEVQPDAEALALLTAEACRQLHALPLLMTEPRLMVAMADPWDLDIVARLEFKSGRRVCPVVALKSDILEAIAAFYESSEQLGRAIQNLVRVQERAATRRDAEASGDAEMEWKNAPVVKLVDYILRQGLTLSASDIHLEPCSDHCKLRYRIDGVLHPYKGPPPSAYPEVVSRIKVMANLDAAETRTPQDGRLTFVDGARHVEFRVSTLPLVHGEGVCLRILDRSGVHLDLKQLGFPDALLPVYQKAINSPHGLIIVSGPTGSGKSTTLYAALSTIATDDRKVITVEDPVEYRTDTACQSPVRSEVGYTFATGLRAILRHDPDVIMIGEMRDQESAEIAIRAALTGHLVLSTIHTNDSVSAVTRLVDMGVPYYLVSATMRLVMSQRLVRLLCPGCKAPRAVSREVLVDVGASARQLELANPMVYEPRGCDLCNQIGYLGRRALFEVLDASTLFAHLKERNPSLAELHEAARAIGLITLRSWGIERALHGDTSLEEVMKVTADSGGVTHRALDLTEGQGR